MKKSKLLIASISALLALGLGASLLGQQKVQRAEAASFVNETLHDEFADGIDSSKYDIIDSEDKVGLVERNGIMKFGNFNFNLGYVRNASPITRGAGQSVVFQFKKIEVPAGQYLILEFTEGYSWGGQMIMTQLDGAIVITGDDRTGTNPDGTATMWIGVNAYSSFRWIWNNDGSLIIQGSNDETTFTTVCTYAASSFTVPTTGYVGLLGNGLTGNVSLDNCKIGVADDATLKNLEWKVEDDFETANSGKFILDTATYTNGEQVFEQAGGVKAVMLSNPASGSGIVTKSSYELAQDSSILFSAQLELELVELGEKAVGLGFGIANDATAANSAYLVGVRHNPNDELVLLSKGQVVAFQELTSALPSTIEIGVVVKVVDEVMKVFATVAGATLEHVVENPEGKLAIAVSGIGNTTAKVLGLTVNSYTGIIETGRDIYVGQSFNHNWLVNNGANGSVTMGEDGFVNFKSAADDTRLQSRFKYVNFDLQFDAKMQQLEEDDEGNVTPASTWLGISFGRNNYEDAYWAANTEMLYMTADTVNSITTQDGHTPTGVPTARGWFTADYLPLTEANKDVVFHYHIVAHDGSVSFSVSRDGGEEVTVIIYEGMKTDGYISFAGTAGANYFLKNIALVNTDGITVANQAPVAQDGTLAVVKGQTGNGQLVATDADEYDADYLTFELVEDNTSDLGELTLNEDGSYTFAATAVGEGTFTFKVSDTEDYSEIKTVTINVSEDPLAVAKQEAIEELNNYYNALDLTKYDDNGRAALEEAKTQGLANINAATTVEEVAAALQEAKAALDAVPEAGSEPTSSESETPEEKPANKGCGGSVIAASVIVSSLTLAGAALLILRRRKEK